MADWLENSNFQVNQTPHQGGFLSSGGDSKNKKWTWSKHAFRLTTALKTHLTNSCVAQTEFPAFNITAKQEFRVCCSGHCWERKIEGGSRQVWLRHLKAYQSKLWERILQLWKWTVFLPTISRFTNVNLYWSDWLTRRVVGCHNALSYAQLLCLSSECRHHWLANNTLKRNVLSCLSAVVSLNRV